MPLERHARSSAAEANNPEHVDATNIGAMVAQRFLALSSAVGLLIQTFVYQKKAGTKEIYVIGLT